MVIVPGAIAFTRTSGASAFASTFVNITTPAFEMECGMKPGHPSSPPASAKFTIAPFVRRSNGAAACAQKNPAFKFVSSDASQISSVVETMLAGKKFAALFTKNIQSPKFFRNLHEQLANLVYLLQISRKSHRAPPHLLDLPDRFLGFRVRRAMVDH